MPDNNYFARYIPLLIQVVVASGLAAVMVSLSHLLGKHKWTRAKNTAYECGITPTGDAQNRFSVKFYMVGMLFILFDVEVVFLYPWAVIYREMLKESGGMILGAMVSFLGVLFIGYLYALKKRAFDWKG